MGVLSRVFLGASCAAALFLAACANGGSGGDAEGDDASPDPGDDSGPLDGAPTGDGTTPGSDGGSNDGPAIDGDAASITDAPPDVPQTPCADSSLGGIGIPTGTVATASGTYGANVAADAIDGLLSSIWNSGGTAASLTLTFPSAVSITGVAIAATASPASTEMYTVTGVSNGVLATIGMASLSVPAATTVLPEIGVTPASYTSITLHVTSSSSWVAIAEVTLVTAHCP